MSVSESVLVFLIRLRAARHARSPAKCAALVACCAHLPHNQTHECCIGSPMGHAGPGLELLTRVFSPLFLLLLLPLMPPTIIVANLASCCLLSHELDSQSMIMALISISRDWISQSDLANSTRSMHRDHQNKKIINIRRVQSLTWLRWPSSIYDHEATRERFTMKNKGYKKRSNFLFASLASFIISKAFSLNISSHMWYTHILWLLNVYEPLDHLSYISQWQKNNDHIIFFLVFFKIMIFIFLASIRLNFISFEVYLPFHQVDMKYCIHRKPLIFLSTWWKANQN